MKYSNLFVASVVVVAIVTQIGCKSSTTSSPGNTTFVHPNVGSTFTYVNITRDTTGAIVFEDTSVQRISQTGVQIGGVNDAIQIIETYADGSLDTSYVRYTASGDIQIPFANGGSNDSLWITLPISTHSPQSIVLDTMLVDGPDTSYDTTSFAITYSREENFTVGSSSLSCSVLSLSITSKGLETNGAVKISDLSKEVSEVSFSHTIGWEVHEMGLTSVDNGTNGGLDESRLLSYTLAP